MPYQDLIVSIAGDAARVTLNRPERRNALSHALLGELHAVLTELGDRCDVAAIVIEGAGPAFSAGHDLAEMIDRKASFYEDLFARCTQVMELVHQLAQPVIAKVHGAATAAGCQLVAACDLAVASEDAFFATPGVHIGLFCSTPMVPISRAVGRKRSLEMLLTGDPIDAATALNWGLVNRVVPAADLEKSVADLVAAITRFSPEIVGLGKRAFYDQEAQAEVAAYESVKPIMSANARHPDAQEGMAAFLEKRAPQWGGR